MLEFQTFKSNDVASKDAKEANIEKKLTNPEQKQVEMLEVGINKLDCRLPRNVENDIEFASAPYNVRDVKFLNELGVSFDIIMHLVEINFLQEIGLTGKPLIISTGMASIEEVDQAGN